MGNLALFDIDADGTDQGHDALPSATVSFTLRSTVGVRTAQLQVWDATGYDPANDLLTNPPRSSPSAPELDLDNGSDPVAQLVNFVPVSGTIQAALPASAGSWIVRCLVNGGQRVVNGVARWDSDLIWERMLVVRTLAGTRKAVVTERREYSDDGLAALLAELADAIGDAVSLAGVDLGASVGAPNPGDILQFSGITGDYEAAMGAADELLQAGVWTADPTVDTLTANEHVRAVADNIVADRGLQAFQYSADAYAGQVIRCKARGNTGAPAIVQNGDQLGRVDDYAYDGSAFYAAFAALSYVSDASPAVGDVGTGFAEYFDAGGGDGYSLRRSYYPIGSGLYQYDLIKSYLSLVGDGVGAALINYRYSGDVGGAALDGRKARGSLATPAIIQNGDTGLHLRNWFYDGTGWYLSAAGYFQVYDGSPAAGDVGTAFVLDLDEGGGGGSAVRFDLHPDGASFLSDWKDTRHTGDSDTFTVEDAISISGGESKTLPTLHFDTADDGSTYTCAAVTIDTNGWCGEIHLTWDAIGGTTAGESASWRRFSKIAINDGLASIVAADDATALGNDNNDAGFIGNFATNLATSGGGIYTIGLDFDGSGVQAISWGVETDVRSFLKAI